MLAKNWSAMGCQTCRVIVDDLREHARSYKGHVYLYRSCNFANRIIGTTV
jgi:hypothetical protein